MSRMLIKSRSWLRPSPLVLEQIVKSLTIPPSQCGSNDSNLWPGSDTTCWIMCLTDPSNNQLVKDERAQIFYSIWSQTKPIGIDANCEIPHINVRRIFTVVILVIEVLPIMVNYNCICRKLNCKLMFFYSGERGISECFEGIEHLACVIKRFLRS